MKYSLSFPIQLKRFNGKTNQFQTSSESSSKSKILKDHKNVCEYKSSAVATMVKKNIRPKLTTNDIVNDNLKEQTLNELRNSIQQLSGLTSVNNCCNCDNYEV